MSSVPPPPWIADSLSSEQLRVITGADRRSSILAGAGSGKTRTLINLLAYDLSLGTPASKIVAFTFTTRAADELLARIFAVRNRHMPHIDLSGIYIGTIHSWCLAYLHSHTDYLNFTPIDELHVDALAGRLYSALNLEESYKKPFPRAIQPFLADLEVFYNEHMSLNDVPSDIRSSIRTFLGTLVQNRLMTFGGMIRSATEILREEGPVQDLQSLYVDEYQDVNPAQIALVKAMLPSEAKLAVVGDELQSIYHWRGSDVRALLNFERDFGEATVYRLSTNYRARPELVALAKDFSATIGVRDREKTMGAIRDASPGRVVHWVSAADEVLQSDTIAEMVTRFHRAGTPYHHIAILMRSLRHGGQAIYDALRRTGIPVRCRAFGRGRTFVDSFLLPMLDWLQAEHREPRNAEEDAQQVRRAAKLWESACGWTTVEDPENVFWDQLHLWYDHLRDGGDAAYDIRGSFYRFLDACGMRLWPFNDDLIDAIGLVSQIIRRVEEVHRRRIVGQPRKSAVSLVRELYFSLRRNHEALRERTTGDGIGQGVVLTTVHQAKGLEWPIVFLPSLDSRRFPIRGRSHQCRFPREVVERYETSVEDERRLFYVAVTRARERLITADTAGGRDQSSSLFLRELGSMGHIESHRCVEASDGTWMVSIEDVDKGSEPPIKVGVSDLLLYIECPYQYWLRRVVGIQPAVEDHLGYGKGLHELIQRRARADGSWNTDEVAAQVATHVHLPLAPHAVESSARRQSARYLEALQEIGVFRRNTEHEVPVELCFPNGIVTGTVDHVHTDGNGASTIVDWKSQLHERFIPRYTRQMRLYTKALQETGRTVESATLVDVKASCESMELITREIDVGEDAMTRANAKWEEAMARLGNQVFAPTPTTASCKACDVRSICGAREEREHA